MDLFWNSLVFSGFLFGSGDRLGIACYNITYYQLPQIFCVIHLRDIVLNKTRKAQEQKALFGSLFDRNSKVVILFPKFSIEFQTLDLSNVYVK